MTSEELQRLRAEIASDCQAFSARLAELRELDDRPTSPALLAQLAVALHHGYGAIEAALVRIARVLERSLPEGADWHSALLHAMTLDIPTVRPRVLSGTASVALRKLLAFRHFFRHAYAAEWDSEQLASLRKVALESGPAVMADLEAFDGVLERLVQELDRT